MRECPKCLEGLEEEARWSEGQWVCKNYPDCPSRFRCGNCDRVVEEEDWRDCCEVCVECHHEEEEEEEDDSVWCDGCSTNVEREEFHFDCDRCDECCACGEEAEDGDLDRGAKEDPEGGWDGA